MKKFGLSVLCLLLASVFVFAGGGQSTSSSEVPTIRVLMPGNVQSFREGENENNNDTHSFLEKITGYKLQYSILPAQGGNERLVLEMASGDPADLIINSNRTLFLQFQQDGYLTVLDDYIAKASPALNSTLMDPSVRDLASVDGKQYGIATPSNSEGGVRTMWGLKSLTDPLGLTGDDMTPEGIRRMFAAAKQAYPDKTILTGPGGSTTGSRIMGFQWLYGAFGIATEWREVNGRLEYSPVTNDQRRLLEYLASLNAAGYIDPEYAVMREERVREKIVQGNVVFINQGLNDYIGLDWKYLEDPVAKETLWRVFGNAQGPDGRRDQLNTGTHLQIAMIPVTSRVTQEAVNLVSHLCTQDAYDFIMLGEKGVDFYYDAAGDVVHITNKRMTPSGQQYFVYYYIYEDIPQRLRRLMATYKTGADGAYIGAINLPIYYSLGTVKDPTATMPPIQVYIDRIGDINTLCAEYFMKIAVGALPVSAFDEFLTQFNRIGGQEMINAVNQWYTTRR